MTTQRMSTGAKPPRTSREKLAFRIAVSGIFFGILALVGSIGTGDRLAAGLAVVITGVCALFASHIRRNGL